MMFVEMYVVRVRGMLAKFVTQHTIASYNCNDVSGTNTTISIACIMQWARARWMHISRDVVWVCVVSVFRVHHTKTKMATTETIRLCCALNWVVLILYCVALCCVVGLCWIVLDCVFESESSVPRNFYNCVVCWQRQQPALLHYSPLPNNICHISILC